MRVLVVRPRAQAEATARRLTLRGHAAMLAPLLTIKETPSPPPDGRPDAILVTSANAAPAAAEAAQGFPTVPVFAVGARTAVVLQELGLAGVRSADGDGVALARLVASSIPAPATLLHIAGKQRRPEPKRSLEAAGYTVLIQEAYAAAPAPALPPPIVAALKSGSLDAVLHFSRGSAATLSRLAEEAGLAAPLGQLLHVCLSDEVGRGLESLRPSRIVVAVRPDEDALLAALDEAAERRHTARPPPIRPVGTGTKSLAGAFRTTKDDSPPMSETRIPDPLKRKPPTIDLKPGEFQSVEPPTAPTPEFPEGAAETAIEPTASLGLDGPAAESGQDRKGKAKVSRTGVPVTGASSQGDPNPTIAEREAGRGQDAMAAGEPAGEALPVQEPSSGPAPRETVSPVEPAPAVQPARRAGSGRLIAAGLVGGLVGSALAVGADRLLGDASDGNADRLTALERRVAAPPAAGSGSGPAEGRLAALEGSVRQAVEAATAARGAAEAASRQASEALARPASPGAPAGSDPALRSALEGLGARVAAVEEVGKRAEASGAAVGALEARIEALGRETTAKLGEAATALGAIESRLTALQSATQSLQSASSGLQGSVQTLTTGAQALGARLTEADSRIVSLSGELAKLSPGAVQAGLRVVVAGRVADALRAGTPLGPSLGALERLGGNAEVVSALKPFAAEPPPAAAALAAEFKPLATQMLAEPSAPASSFSDRLLRIADKVVTVRAIGDGTGNDLPGLVARLEGALGRGALPEAARLWDGLPAEAKRLSAAWADRLKRRVAADEAMARLSAETIAALEASTR